MKTDGKKIIDATKMSLNEWLSLLDSEENEDVLFINYMFPTDNMREEYLQTIQTRTDEEVINLLRNFLISSGTLGADKSALENLMYWLGHDKDRFEKMMEIEYYRRLLGSFNGKTTIWEGNTWIIDILKISPKLALDALQAYFLAHIQLLPDGRFQGLQDALAIIREKFIHTPKSSLLLDLESYQFEHLIESLYMEMGYETTLTQMTHDKGRDIIAEKKDIGKKEKLLIECKTSQKNISVKEVRALLGVVSSEKATKGVLISNSEFTAPSKKFEKENRNLELIGNKELQVLLNSYFGSNWSQRIDFIISRSLSKLRKKTGH